MISQLLTEVASQGRTWGEFFQSNRQMLVVKPLRILFIIIIALVARWLLHRAVSRAVRSTRDNDARVVFKPLRERLGNGPPETTGLITERRRQRAEAVGSLLRSIASLVIGVLALMLVLGEVGFQLGPFIAGAGVVGVALGFGAQNLVRDYLSGIFIILEDQYGVGDVIELGEVTGTVESVELRVTRMRDVRGTVWYVRNGEVLRVGNRSQGYAQVIVDLPVGHGADLTAVGAAMKSAADGLAAEPRWEEAVLEEPELVGVEQIGQDSVVLRLTVKVRPADQWELAPELRRRIADRLDASGAARDRAEDLAVSTRPVRDESTVATGPETPPADPARP